MNIFDFLIFAAVYIFLGIIIVEIFCGLNKDLGLNKQKGTLVSALFYRMLFTWFYYYVSIRILGSDSMLYHDYAQNPQHYDIYPFFVTGTFFIGNIARFFYPFASLFNDTYLMLYVPFSLLGFIGTLIFYKLIRHLDIEVNRLACFFIFFMPNLIYWTSNIGKDSVIYLAIVAILYCAVVSYERIRVRRLICMLFFGALAYFIRPHVLACLLVAFLLGLFLKGRKISFKNIIVIIIAFLFFNFLMSKIFSYIGLTVEGDSLADIQKGGAAYIERWSTYYTEQGSGIERNVLVSYLYAPFYAIWWLIVPFFLQAKKAIHLFAVFDGLIMQITLAYILININNLIKTKLLPVKNFIITYILITASIFGMAMSNFGLIVRQRVMVVPFVIALLLVIRQEKLFERRGRL